MLRLTLLALVLAWVATLVRLLAAGRASVPATAPVRASRRPLR